MSSSRAASGKQAEFQRDELVEAFAKVGAFIGGMLWEMAERERTPPKTESNLNEPLLLKPAQAAAKLGVSKSTLHRLHHEGRLPAVQVGSSRRYARNELERISVEGLAPQPARAQRTRVTRSPAKPSPAAPPVERHKGLTRKPTAVDHYAAKKYGLDLRTLKISGELLQEILGIDAKQYKAWAYEGGALPDQALQKFDSWCSGFVESIRTRGSAQQIGLIDPASPLE